MREASNPAGMPSVTAIVTSWPAAEAVRACARMTEFPPPIPRSGMRKAILKSQAGRFAGDRAKRDLARR